MQEQLIVMGKVIKLQAWNFVLTWKDLKSFFLAVSDEISLS
jgi:hypothetical protein